jgi:two-component system LytT family response regulator
MSPVNIIIADPESDTSRQLGQLIECYPNVQILGTYGELQDSLQALRTAEVDIMFVDCQLPGLWGQSPSLRDKTMLQKPLLVAMSRTEQDAFQAIAHFAFSFLLKPVGRTDLARVLLNAHALLQHEPTEAYSQYPTKLWFANGHDVLALEEPGVLMLQAAGNYLCIHTTAGNYVVRATLKAVLPRLPKSFVQIHRSTLINLHHLRRLSMQKGVLMAELSDQSQLPVSRRFRRLVQPLLHDFPLQ